MRNLMLSCDVNEVSMESMSIYWIPIWRMLDGHITHHHVNHSFIKQLPGHMSDIEDAQWIAECTMKDLIGGSFVPSEVIQKLRQWDHCIFAFADLDEEIVRKLANLDGVFQRGNIRLSLLCSEPSLTN